MDTISAKILGYVSIGAAVGGMSVGVILWMKTRKRPWARRPFVGQACVWGGMVVGFSTGAFYFMGKAFLTQEWKDPNIEERLNIPKGCPAYLECAQCAEDQNCLNYAKKEGDPFRMMEGYWACKNRQSNEFENQDGYPPRVTDGFVSDDD